MNKIDEIINKYQEEELINFKKHLNDYIVPLNNLEWLHLSGDELIVFLNKNYSINNEKIDWKYQENIKNVLGMKYLSFDTIGKSFKYIIGIIPNKINKKTIVCASCLYNNYKLFSGENDTLNKIYYIETNAFYQEHGLFHLMVNEIIKEIDFKKDLIFNDETKIGLHYNCYQYLIDELHEQDFDRSIHEEKNVNKEYMLKLGYHG